MCEREVEIGTYMKRPVGTVWVLPEGKVISEWVDIVRKRVCIRLVFTALKLI